MYIWLNKHLYGFVISCRDRRPGTGDIEMPLHVSLSVTFCFHTLTLKTHGCISSKHMHAHCHVGVLYSGFWYWWFKKCTYTYYVVFSMELNGLPRGYGNDFDKCLNRLKTWPNFMFDQLFMWMGVNNDQIRLPKVIFSNVLTDLNLYTVNFTFSQILK